MACVPCVLCTGERELMQCVLSDRAGASFHIRCDTYVLYAQDGKATAEAKEAVVGELARVGRGGAVTNFRLRDWVFSR